MHRQASELREFGRGDINLHATAQPIIVPLNSDIASTVSKVIRTSRRSLGTKRNEKQTKHTKWWNKDRD